MTGLPPGSDRPGHHPAAACGLFAVADLDPLDRAAFDLAIGEEIEQAGPEADMVTLMDRAMVRLQRWKARRPEAALMAQIDRVRVLAALGASASRRHPDRRLVAACEQLLTGTPGHADWIALQDSIANMRARTAMGRRAKAEVALALLDASDLPVAELARSVILEALASLPADRV